MPTDPKIKAAVLRHLKTKNPGTYKAIAEKFGVGAASVRTWAIAATIKKPDNRSNRPSTTTERDKEIRKLRRSKNKPSLSTLASQFGLSKQRVHAICAGN